MTALLYLIQIYRVVDRFKGLRVQGSGLWQRLHHPPLRGTFPSRGRLCVEDSVVLVSQPSPLGKGDRAAVDRVLSYIVDLRRISPLIFHTAIPIQPPPLRGTSFLWKEGVSTQAPSLGRGCRAQRGGVGFLFLAAKPPPLCLPHAGKAVFRG